MPAPLPYQALGLLPHIPRVIPGPALTSDSEIWISNTSPFNRGSHPPGPVTLGSPASPAGTSAPEALSLVPRSYVIPARGWCDPHGTLPHTLSPPLGRAQPLIIPALLVAVPSWCCREGAALRATFPVHAMSGLAMPGGPWPPPASGLSLSEWFTFPLFAGPLLILCTLPLLWTEGQWRDTPAPAPRLASP